MVRIMRIVSYDDISKNFDSFYNSVSEDLDTIMVRKEGTDGIVMMPLNEYNSLLETLHLMSSPETRADIRQAEVDLNAGKGIEVDIEKL